MRGLLEPRASSIEAANARYLEGDLLGKSALRSWRDNALQVPDSAQHMPLRRRVDVGDRIKPEADVLVETDGLCLSSVDEIRRESAQT